MAWQLHSPLPKIVFHAYDVLRYAPETTHPCSREAATELYYPAHGEHFMPGT